MDHPPHDDSLLAQRMPERFVYFALLALIGFVVALAWPGLTSKPLLDDLDHKVHVATFTGWKDTLGTDCFQLFRPFKNIAYYGFHRLGNPSPVFWHSVPLGFYLGAITAVFALARRLTRSPGYALAAAALWALSASQTTTVLWMACFNISLSVIFTCIAVILYDRSWDSPRPWAMSLPACLVATFLALLSYETSLCIAPVCVALDAFRQRRIFSKPAILRYLALAVVSISYLALRFSIGGTTNASHSNFAFAPDMPPWQLSLSAPWLMWRHFSMWFFPFGRLEFQSTYVWGKSASMLDLAGAWGFFLLLAGVWFAALRRLPLLAFGLAWFFLASFPSSNFIPLRSGPIEDYYVVVPGFGLALAVIALLQAARTAFAARRESSFTPGQLTVTCLTGLIVVIKLAGVPFFYHQATLWQDPLRLYLSIAYNRPAQFQQKTLAAQELIQRGDFQPAKALIEDSRADAPWLFTSDVLLGELAFQAGDYQEAAASFDRAEATAKMSIRHQEYFRLRRAKMLLLSGKPAEARQMLMPLLQRSASEQHYPATLILAEIYQQQGDPGKARQTLEKSSAIHPERHEEIQQRILQLTAGNSQPPGQ